MSAAKRYKKGMLVWWATEIECASALARLEREGDLTAEIRFKHLPSIG